MEGWLGEWDISTLVNLIKVEKGASSSHLLTTVDPLKGNTYKEKHVRWGYIHTKYISGVPRLQSIAM
jgi:hypothetical protein